ncbi:MAG: hypothetical protein HRU00_11750 [Myxococcales bacterium]|nr:hypothetical protein [Myxococcales bacterium]
MTTLVTTAGPLNVLKAEVTELLEGAWTARVEVDTDDEITGAVVLTEGVTTWTGSIKPDLGAQEHGRFIAQLVGGTGGLSGILGVRNYDSPFLSDILSDIMTDAGEVLSPEVDTTVLVAQVERWSRLAGPGGLSLKQITDESTADHWRIRRDGLVWLGAETYPAVSPTFDFTEISRDPAQNSITIAPEDGQLLPAVGESFLDHNVVGVVTTIEEGSLRQTISWESGNGGDRLLGPMENLINAFVGRKIDYAKMYPSVVKAQNADGTLDLTPDDESIRGNGFKRIQISYGLPGVTALVPSGGRVNLYFQNGDPKQPRAALWEGSGVTALTVDGGSEEVLRGTSFVSALDTFVDALNTYIVVPVPSAPQTATWAAAVVAFKLALTTSTTSVLKVP